MLDMEIQDRPALRVACVRHVGPFTELAPAFQTICGWAGAQGLFGPDTRVIGLFYDDPKVTPAPELRSAAAVTVDRALEVPEGIEFDEVAGGAYAVGIHKGPYEGLHAAYTWIFGEWLPGSGREPAEAPTYEIYLNDASQTPPSELLTAIHIPLR